MKKTSLPFAKANYTLMLVGIALILLGFLVMSMDTAEFGFGTLGLVVGPIIVLSGFATEFFAILKK
jgi:Protein of unknown function (DUF3098)